VKQPNRLEDWQREIELTPASKEQSEISNQKKSAGSLREHNLLWKSILTWTCITKKAVSVMNARCKTNGRSSMEHFLRFPLRFWLVDPALSSDAEDISVGADFLCLTLGCPVHVLYD
jgi:hypothetical protein